MKEKIKLVIVFILGIMISVVISVYAATVIAASEVSYTSNTTVETGLNNLYTKANTMANDITALKKKGCFTYSGTTNANGSLTVTHNKGLGTNYYPVVMNGNSANAIIPYAITGVSTNSFIVTFASISSFVLANPGAKAVTINWCY